MAALALFFFGYALFRWIKPDGPPFRGRSARAFTELHQMFGDLGPALPWFGLGLMFALLFAVARRTDRAR
jgi:hypothetical protein